MLGPGLSALLSELLFALEQLVELELVQGGELFTEASAILHPLAYGFFQGARDVQQGLLVVVADGEVQRTMQVSSLTAAVGFAAGASSFDQGAAQEGHLGDQLGESGTCVTFDGRT
jgi:hypothetical protein